MSSSALGFSLARVQGRESIFATTGALYPCGSEPPRPLETLGAARTRVGHGDALAVALGFANPTDIVSFAGGFPDPLTFPRGRAAALLAEFAESGEATAFQYTPTQGLAGARDAVAGRLDAVQDRRPADDELLITSGGIEALELVGKTFLDRGDTVVVEGPTYLGAIMAFRGFEAEIVTVPMDEDGLQVDELERRLADGLRTKLLYTIPDHQNPAGVTSSLERREALVELARRYGFLVVEDVAYRELTFGDESLPSLWSLAPDVVVQAGTISKIFSRVSGSAGRPGLREIVAQLVSGKAEHPTSARARSASGCWRNTDGRGWIERAAGEVACPLPVGRASPSCSPPSSAHMPDGSRGRRRAAVSSPG